MKPLARLVSKPKSGAILGQFIISEALTGKVVILDVSEISGSGFAVNEDEQKTVLLPGMLIPSLELRLSNIFSINCSARVVHRTLSAEQNANNGLFVCGIVFTDMNMGDHTKLVAFLQQAKGVEPNWKLH